jgi:hypothetical protein
MPDTTDRTGTAAPTIRKGPQVVEFTDPGDADPVEARLRLASRQSLSATRMSHALTTPPARTAISAGTRT